MVGWKDGKRHEWQWHDGPDWEAKGEDCGEAERGVDSKK